MLSGINNLMVSFSVSEQTTFYVAHSAMNYGEQDPTTQIKCVFLKGGNSFASVSYIQFLLDRSTMLVVNFAQIFSLLPFTINHSGEH